MERPELYTCLVRAVCQDEVLDEDRTVFGIRKLELSAQSGLKVNGQEVKLRGACIHLDNGILGAAAYKDADERKIRLLKEAGFNCIVHDYSTVFGNAWEEDVKRMVEKDFNHPSLFQKKKVSVHVEGAVELFGFGNADTQAMGSYDDTEWETYDGYVMAVIRAGRKPGKAKVVFSAEGCKDQIVEFEVK